MKYLIFTFLFFAVLSTTVFSQSENDTTTAQQKVLQTERNIMNATIAGDTKRLNELFADNIKGYFESEEIDKAFILKNYTHPITDVSAKEINMDARIYGNAAVVHGIWQITRATEKPQFFQFTDMFIQQNNNWQEVSFQQNPIPVWKARKNLDDSEFEAITQISCDSEPTLKSLNSDVPAFIRFKNNTSNSLTVYWINYDGTRDTSADQIRPIEAGKSMDVETFLTHPFIIMSASGKCYGIYEAKAEPSLAIIKD